MPVRSKGSVGLAWRLMGWMLLGVAMPVGGQEVAPYRVLDLGPGAALGINDFGVVVGQTLVRDSANRLVARPVLWENGQRMSLLLNAGILSATASNINNAGVIVGWGQRTQS